MIPPSQAIPSTENLPYCPVCTSTKFILGRQVFDDRYGHPGIFNLSKCVQCGHMMTIPRLEETDLPGLYGGFYPRKNITALSVTAQVSAGQRPFARFRRWLMGVDNQGQYAVKPGEKLLDIGCGSGASLLEAKALGAEAFGIEADPNVQHLATELGLNIHQGGIYDRPFPSEVFDLIVLNQVIEHIPEPDKALCQIADRLDQAGRIILVFPNRDSLWCRLAGPSWINWHIPYHLHHFNEFTFTLLANRCGFKVIKSRTVTPNLWTLLQWRASNNHLAVQGKPNPIWKVSSHGTVQAQREGERTTIRRVTLMFVLVLVAVVTRAVDLLGFGDSLMMELRRASE